jgi:hypothetical protein
MTSQMVPSYWKDAAPSRPNCVVVDPEKAPMFDVLKLLPFNANEVADPPDMIDFATYDTFEVAVC